MAEEEKTENTPEPAEEPTEPENATPTPAEPPQAADTGGTGVPQSAKQWAMFCHLAALAGYIGIPFGNVIGPLIVWLIKKDEFEYVNQQGKEALNFQISLLIYCIAATPLLCAAGLAVVVWIAIGVFALVCVILAAIKTNQGEDFRYPLCIRFIK